MPVALTNIGPKTYFSKQDIAPVSIPHAAHRVPAPVFGSIFSSSTVFVYFCIRERSSQVSPSGTTLTHSEQRKRKGYLCTSGFATSSSLNVLTLSSSEAMDNLFGMVERTDAEKAVLGYEDDKKAEETASHVENATSVGARGRERTNEVAVMGTISERQT